MYLNLISMFRVTFLLLILLSSCTLQNRGAYYNKKLKLPSFSVTLIKSKTISDKLTNKLFFEASKQIFNEIGVEVNLDKIHTADFKCPFIEIEFCTWHIRDKLVKNEEIYSDIVYILGDWRDQNKLKESPIRGFAEQVGAVKYKYPSAAVSFNQNIFWSDSAVMAHEIAHLLGANHQRHGIMKASNPYMGLDGGFTRKAIKEIHSLLLDNNSFASFKKGSQIGVIPLTPWSDGVGAYARPKNDIFSKTTNKQ